MDALVDTVEEEMSNAQAKNAGLLDGEEFQNICTHTPILHKFDHAVSWNSAIYVSGINYIDYIPTVFL